MRVHGTALMAGFTAAGLLLVGLGAAVTASTSAASDPAPTEYLWMLTAAGGTIDGIGEDTGDEALTLTLSGVNDHATQFADRPARDAFVISTPDFADRWDDWFGSTPPNAVLSYVVAGEAKPHGIVLEIDDPEYDSAAGTITFTARHLHRGSDPHPNAIAPIEVAPRTAPASFRSASLFIDSAGDGAVVASTDPSDETSSPAATDPPATALASPTPTPSSTTTMTPAATATDPGTSIATPPADAVAASSGATDAAATPEVATVRGRITPLNVSLGDGSYTFDPAADSTAGGSSTESGISTRFVTRVAGNPSTSTFDYQVYELGAPTGIWVRGQATAYPASSWSRDTSSCEFFRGNPASGAAKISGDSQPYQCSMSYLTTDDPGEYVVRYEIAPKVWATVRGSMTPTDGISLTAGQLSAENTRWDFDGKPVTGPLAVSVVPSSATDTWAAFHRGGDTNTHAARVDFSYQVVDDGVVTPYWVGGHTENYRGAEFDHDGTCTIYSSNPFTTDAKPASLSPYTCTASGTDLAGRGDWKVEFTLSPRPAKVIDAVAQPVIARQLLEAACTKTGATCDYIPTSIADANLPGVRVSKKTANSTSEPVTGEVDWSYEHSVDNSVGVDIIAKDSFNMLIEEVVTTVKLRWSVDVTNSYTTTTKNTLTVPPGCASWWVLSPAYKAVDGDFVVSNDDTIYRIKGVSWTLPEDPTSGNDGGLMGGTLTAASEPIEGSTAKCTMSTTPPASGAGG